MWRLRSAVARALVRRPTPVRLRSTPAGGGEWHEQRDTVGRTYYRNTASKAVTYDKPDMYLPLSSSLCRPRHPRPC